MAQVGLSRTIVSKAVETSSAAFELDPAGAGQISRALNALLADSFALYLKTKYFHWRAGSLPSGAEELSNQLEFGEHADDLFASTDDLAARVRAIGGRSSPLGDIGQLRRIRDGERRFARRSDMLSELTEDNEALMEAIRDTRGLCERHNDILSLALLETLVDQTERRSHFLLEMSRESDGE